MTTEFKKREVERDELRVLPKALFCFYTSAAPLFRFIVFKNKANSPLNRMSLSVNTEGQRGDGSLCSLSKTPKVSSVQILDFPLVAWSKNKPSLKF